MNKLTISLCALAAAVSGAYFLTDTKEAPQTKLAQPTHEAHVQADAKEAQPPAHLPTTHTHVAKTDKVPPMEMAPGQHRAPAPPLQPNQLRRSKHGHNPHDEHGHEHHNHKKPQLRNGKVPPTGANY